ncbi:MAG: Rhodanese domain protein [Herbinix sp.]|jgi:rhodanese-related sulfurtransferase|nr:Rhodanese domain protein [Herbinix sp.]
MFSLFQRNDGNSVHMSEIDNMLNEINLIDIREPFECARGCIKTAKNIPMTQLLADPEKYLDKSKKYYIMCQSGGRSSGATSTLSRAGYEVVNVRGGMERYTGNNRK